MYLNFARKKEMATLSCPCCSDEELMIGTIPDDCGSQDFGYPYLILLQNPNAVNAFAGSVPLEAEIVALMLAADETHISVLGPITNGKKEEASRETETGADTTDGLDNILSQNIKISGKFKLLNTALLTDLAALNCFTRVRMWYITSKGYLFGGDTGFKVPNFFSEWLHDGFGTRSYVPVEFQYKVDRATDYSATAQDDDYLTLNN